MQVKLTNTNSYGLTVSKTGPTSPGPTSPADRDRHGPSSPADRVLQLPFRLPSFY